MHTASKGTGGLSETGVRKLGKFFELGGKEGKKSIEWMPEKKLYFVYSCSRIKQNKYTKINENKRTKRTLHDEEIYTSELVELEWEGKWSCDELVSDQ